MPGTTNRPRSSLLDMFDPLASPRPSTPTRRDVHSPDSGSDKENAEPAYVPSPASAAAGTGSADSPLTLTKFFSRTYTQYKALPPKMPPMGVLIDFGDVTIGEDTDLDNLDGVLADEDEHDGDDEHENENDENGENGQAQNENRDEDENAGPSLALCPSADRHVSAAPVTTDVDAMPQRRPLADILLDDQEQHQHQPFSSPLTRELAAALANTPLPAFGAPKLTAAPATSPLASVINAINGTATAPPTRTSPTSTSSPSSSSPSTSTVRPTPPQIRVIPPEHLVSAQPPLSPPDVDSSAPTSPESPSPPRPRITTTGTGPRGGTAASASDLDPRRSSVDLQASFSMHFQCPEVSFDLLNDKISFLGLGQESMMDMEGEDGFDMAEEERAMNALAERLGRASLGGSPREPKAKARVSEPRPAKTEAVEPDTEVETEDELAVDALVERLRDVQLDPAAGDRPPSRRRSSAQPPALITPVQKRESQVVQRHRASSNATSSSERTPQASAPIKQRVPVHRASLSALALSAASFMPTEPAAGPAPKEKEKEKRSRNAPPERRLSFLRPAPTVPIAALRIVKKPRAESMAARRSSALPPRNTTSTAAPEPGASQSAQANLPAPAPRARTVIHGLQRPPTGTELPKTARASEIAARVRGAAVVSAAGVPRPAAPAATTATVASSRAPAAGTSHGAPASKLQPPAGPPAGLARRPSMAAVSGTSKIGAPSGLRPPSRFGVSGLAAPASASASAPPVPRLPAAASTRVPAPSAAPTTATATARDPVATMRKLKGSSSRGAGATEAPGPAGMRAMRKM